AEEALEAQHPPQRARPVADAAFEAAPQLALAHRRRPGESLDAVLAAAKAEDRLAHELVARRRDPVGDAGHEGVERAFGERDAIREPAPGVAPDLRHRHDL